LGGGGGATGFRFGFCGHGLDSRYVGRD
jgi:hypothetical protein